MRLTRVLFCAAVAAIVIGIGSREVLSQIGLKDNFPRPPPHGSAARPGAPLLMCTAACERRPAGEVAVVIPNTAFGPGGTAAFNVKGDMISQPGPSAATVTPPAGPAFASVLNPGTAVPTPTPACQGCTRSPTPPAVGTQLAPTTSFPRQRGGPDPDGRVPTPEAIR